MNPYDYSSDTTPASLYLKETTNKRRHYTVAFPTAHPTSHQEYNTVRGEYYQPQHVTSAPLAILVHGIGDASVIPCRWISQSLVRRNIACFVLYLMFHSSRIPDAVKVRFPALTAEEWLESYQVSVIDIRQVIDWASRRAEINPEQVAVLGISFGGIVSAIAIGIDRRIKAGIFVVSAGNSTKVNHLSKSTAYRNRYQITAEEYQCIQSEYAKYLSGVAEKGFENVISTQPSFLTDPMTFASQLRGRRILMLNALWDKYIPRETVKDFWQACGEPPIKWFLAGHASIWLWYPIISQEITSFLTSTLEIPDNTQIEGTENRTS